MQNRYTIDSDSDEEDDYQEESAISPITPDIVPHIENIQKLKDKTAELLDPSWKESRTQHLISKMLELEEPAITAKMVDFLLQDGVCETLLNFITQVRTGRPRPGPTGDRSNELKLSYRAIVLLSADEPSEPLLMFLSRRATIIARKIFDIFLDDSAASFYHGYRVLECLLRCFPGETYEGICGDGQGAERIASLLQYIGYAPVGELLMMIVMLTPVSRMSAMYSTSSKNRWQFFEQLSHWVFMLRLTEIVIDPETTCYLSGEVTAEEHSSAAATILQELIEKLSLEDTGELLLQPLGYTPELLDKLVETATASAWRDDNRRRWSARLLCFLLRKAAEPEIMCIFSSGNGGPPTTSLVPSRLYPLRERIISQLETKLDLIFESILVYGRNDDCLASGEQGADTSIVDNRNSTSAVAYSSYTVDRPFTALRALLIEFLVLLVESDEVVASLIPGELWRHLLDWAILYAHNNVYHAIFYRLIFAVLRQNQEQAQIMLIRDQAFLDFLIDSFVPVATPTLPGGADDSNIETGTTLDQPPGAASGGECDGVGGAVKVKKDESLRRKVVSRGLIINCANAVRLQMTCTPPTSFLRQYLGSHTRWNEFLPGLLRMTEFQQHFGMGIKMSDYKPQSQPGLPALAMVSGPDMKMAFNGESEDGGGIQHGSRFAKSLGFYDEVEWSEGQEGEARSFAEDADDFDLHALSSSREDNDDKEGSISLSSDQAIFDEEDSNESSKSETSLSSSQNSLEPRFHEYDSADEGDTAVEEADSSFDEKAYFSAEDDSVLDEKRSPRGSVSLLSTSLSLSPTLVSPPRSDQSRSVNEEDRGSSPGLI